MELPDTLADLRNFLYQRGEQKWITSLSISFGVLGLTITGLWLQSTFLIGIGALASVVAPIAIAWLRESASLDLQRGDKCRRLILYADSLGHEVPASQMATVRAWALGGSISPAPFVRPYYVSRLVPGPQRLADNVTEAAFFTHALATKLQVGLWTAFGIAVIVAATSLILADLAKGIIGATGVAAAKSIGVVLSFLISGDFALLAKKYGDLKNDARLVFEASSRLREDSRATIDDVSPVCEDYGVALLQSPPVPSWLYLRYQSELNRLYRESHFQGREGAGPN